MGKIISKLYEHLKTYKKYNTLKLKYEVLQEDLEKKILEYEQLKYQQRVIKEVWEQKLQEQEEKIIELKRRKRK